MLDQKKIIYILLLNRYITCCTIIIISALVEEVETVMELIAEKIISIVVFFKKNIINKYKLVTSISRKW